MITHSGDFKCYDDYLRKVNGEYYYYILGKNGEPIEDVQVTVSLTHAFGLNWQSSVTSVTDEEGKISIGKLDNVIKVSVTFQGRYGYNSCEWSLPQRETTFSYPSSLNVLEDEVVEIPFTSSKITDNNFSLLKCNSQNKVIENLSKLATLSKDEEFDQYNLVISNLEFGNYKINLKEIGKVISLHVHQGVYWESDTFILKKNCIVEKREKSNFIHISKPKIVKEDKKDKKTKDEETKPQPKLEFKIKGFKTNTRVHVFGLTFLPNNLLESFYDNQRLTYTNSDINIYEFANWKNAYLSNRELGDEYRYVFERKLLERYIGNTLDRPQLVLKRNKLGTTQFDQESLSVGTTYRRQGVESYNDFQSNSRYDRNSNVAPMMYQQQVAFGAKSIPSYNPPQSTTSLNIGGQTIYLAQPQFKSFLNFLSQPAFIAENLHPDINGTICLPIDTSKYSSLLILACDEETCTEAFFDLPNSDTSIPKRDLSLNDPLDSTKYYKEVRNSENHFVDKNGKKTREKFVIEDITSTEHIVIDSLDKVKKVQDEVRKLHGLQAARSDVLFLLKWSGLSEEEKDKKYNKYVSHEINVFLYFKDREYFKKKIHPFLLNKMEKTFVDHYLLGNEDVVLKYAQIEKFSRLNPFEKCLLIDVVINYDKKTALKLAEWLELNSETTKPSEEQQNKIFDTVLNLNMLQGGNRIQLDDLQEDSSSDVSPDVLQFSNLPPSAPPPPPGMSLFGGPPAPQQNLGFGGGGMFGGGASSSNGLFANASSSSSLFGGNIQRSSGFGSNINNYPQNNLFQVQQQQNMFNVQNQMLDNFQQFNQIQANEGFMPQYQQNYLPQDNDLFDLRSEAFEIRQQMPSQFQALEEA